MCNAVPPAAPGVYCLWNKITNQIYVGSSKNLNKRITQHFSSQCHNSYLKRSIKKYGKENFSITWFETKTELFEEEQRLLCEASGGNQRVPLFLICTGTGFLTRIESSYEGERLGLGLGCNLSSFSKPNCLNRVKTCLVAKSESKVKSKLEAWLKIPRNNPIVLELPLGTKQSALYKLANVSKSSFSLMYKKSDKPKYWRTFAFSHAI